MELNGETEVVTGYILCKRHVGSEESDQIFLDIRMFCDLHDIRKSLVVHPFGVLGLCIVDRVVRPISSIAPYSMS